MINSPTWQDIMVVIMWIFFIYLLIRFFGSAIGKGSNLGPAEVFFTLMVSFWMSLAFMEIVRYRQDPMHLVVSAIVIMILFIYTYSERVRSGTLSAFGFGGKK